MATEEEIRMAVQNLVQSDRAPDPLGRSDPIARMTLESVADPELLVELTVEQQLTKPPPQQLNPGVITATLMQIAQTLPPAGSPPDDDDGGVPGGDV